MSESCKFVAIPSISKYVSLVDISFSYSKSFQCSLNDRFRFIIIFRLNGEFLVAVRKCNFWARSRNFCKFWQAKNNGRASSNASVTSPTKRSEVITEKRCSLMVNLTIEIGILGINKNSFTCFSMEHVFIIFSQD